MKWLDEIAQHVAYPLRATWVDKVLIVLQAATMCALVIIGIVALVRRMGA